MFWRNRTALTAGRYLLLLFLLTTPAWAPLTRPGLPASQAGPAAVLQLYALERGADPALLPLPDGWRMAGPWPLWLARGLHAVGWDAVTAVKIVLGLALLATGLGLLLWAGRQNGWQAGILAAMLVLYAPAWLGTLYAAGQGPVLWVSAGLALIGAGTVCEQRRWGSLLTAFGAWLAVGSLPLLGVVALVGMLLWMLWQRRWSYVVVLLAGILIALALAAPGVTPTGHTRADQVLQLYRLIEPAWFWDANTISRLDWPVWSLGPVLIALLLILLWVGADGKRSLEAKEVAASQRGSTLVPYPLVAALIGALYLAPGFSSLAAYVSEPWHFVLVGLVWLSVAAAGVSAPVPGLRRGVPWAALLVMVVLAAGPGLSPLFETPAIPETPPRVFDGGQAVLLDLQVEGSAQPGEPLTIRSQWVAWQIPDFDYNIFIHLEDASGKRVAQLDTQPQAGARPMTTWQPGEVIDDTYSLTIPAGALPPFTLRFGLYNWQTLERLPVEGGDALTLEVAG